MTGFEQTQRAFVEALRDPAILPPAEIAGAKEGLQRRRRFNVYRNNIYAGLVGVLEARYPAVQRIVGAEFFRAMARVFIDQAPPRSPVLLEYGQGFGEFLGAFEPISDEPYLPDVARLEWQMHAARHAADSLPLRVSGLAAFGEGGAELRIRFAPAVSLVSSAYPIFSLWRANVAETVQTGPMIFSGAECVLVSRPALAPEAIRIPCGCAAFIAALLDAATLGEAAEAAFEVQQNFPLNRAFALLVAQKAIAAVVPPHSEQKDVQT